MTAHLVLPIPQQKPVGDGTTNSSHGDGSVAPKWKVLRIQCLLFAAACLVPLGYAAFTNHVWEDFFITFRHSENLIDGRGLVYNPGEKTHGFTSPLGVLLPALCYLITGKTSYVAALWLFRFLCVAAFAGAGHFLLRATMADGPLSPRLAPLFLIPLFVFDAKAVAYTVNGMETAFMLLFLAWGVYLLAKGQPEQWIGQGVCWAGLMWTRPDGCVYIAGLAFAGLVFGKGARGRVLISYVKSAGVCTALYLPWFAWSWSYYGSPIPNTIVAKSGGGLGMHDQMGRAFNMLVNLPTALPEKAAEVFRPIYYKIGTAPWLEGPGRYWVLALNLITKLLGASCLVYWALPVLDRVGRMASLCFAVVCIYFTYMGFAFPWYLPPAAILGTLVVVRGIPTLTDVACRWFPQREFASSSRAIAFAALLVVSVGQVGQFGLITWQMKIQQAEIELGNRTQVGQWLRENARPTDSVYLEPVGYIGYYSGIRVVDYPGLVAPVVVRLRREQQMDMFTIIPEVAADWVVLRPHEEIALSRSPAVQQFRQNYTRVKTFDVGQNLAKYRFIPGKDYLMFDSVFSVYRRNKADGNATEEIAASLSPVACHDIAWAGATGDATGSDPYAVFQIEQPKRVRLARIEVDVSNPENLPAQFQVYWDRTGQTAFAEERSFQQTIPAGAGLQTLTVYIGEEIDRLRLDPDVRDCHIELKSVTLLCESDAPIAQVGQRSSVEAATRQ